MWFTCVLVSHQVPRTRQGHGQLIDDHHCPSAAPGGMRSGGERTDVLDWVLLCLINILCEMKGP